MSSDEWPDSSTDPLPGRGVRLTAVFLVVVGIGLLAAWIFNTDDPAIASIGGRAPDFEVETLAGEPVTLSALLDQDDRPIVINLMASWCGPCREEIPEISAFADAHPEVMVIGVGVEDTLGNFTEFMDQVRPSYLTAFDDGEMRKAYQSLGLPATFFVNSDGTVGDIFNGILNADVLEQRVAELG